MLDCFKKNEPEPSATLRMSAAAPMNVCEESEDDNSGCLGLDEEVGLGNERSSPSIKTITLWTCPADVKRVGNQDKEERGIPYKVDAQRAGVHSTYIHTVLNKTKVSDASETNINVSLSGCKFATARATELVASYINNNAEKRKRLKAPLQQKELRLEENCSESDIKLLNQCECTQDVTNLINLADFLDMESLFVLACGKIASLVRNQPTRIVEERLKPEYRLNPEATADSSSDVEDQKSSC